MSERDVLDLAAKDAIESPLANPIGPFPGNLNTIDPNPWQDMLWTDVGDMLGLNGMGMPRGFGLRDAVGLAIAIQCADVVADDIARAEMVLWQKKLVNGRREYQEVDAADHWFADMLVRRPNAFMSWKHFWRMTTMHLKLAQNAYVVIEIDRMGNVTSLVPVPPARVQERIGEAGGLFYEIAITTEYERALHGLPPGRTDNLILPSSRVIHMRGRTMSGLKGWSNLDLGSGLFRLVDAISEYQSNLFHNEGETNLVFETDQAFTGEMADAAFRRLKDQLTQRVRKNRRNGEPLLLEAGLKAKSVAVNSKDSLTVETYNAMVLRICGLMRVSPHKIMHLESQKYDNQAHANDAYANTSLIPVAEEIEECFRLSVLEDSDWGRLYPEFDRMALMATDAASLTKILDTFVKNGVMELNEARDKLPLGLNPLPNGDVRYVPVNVAVIDRDGNVVQQAAEGQNQGAGQGDGDNPSEENDETQERRLRLVATQDRP